MSFYLMVEGRATEPKVYPSWISYLAPHYKQVKDHTLAADNNYYLFSAMGYPSILDDILPSILDIKECGLFSHLIVCVDCDNEEYAERYREVEEVITKALKKEKMTSLEYHIIIQNRCFETWLLGNRRLFPRQPQNPLFLEFLRFYNVMLNDPEEMPCFGGYNSISQFHHDYFKKMVKEKRERYSKNNPALCQSETFFGELQSRIKNTPHLESFKNFVDLMKNI